MVPSLGTSSFKCGKRTIKQNKAFCTGPIRKTKRRVPDQKKQNVMYRTNKQNKALCTGPISKTTQSVLDQSAKQSDPYWTIPENKLYCNGQLTKESILYRTIKQKKAFCTGPISKTKRSVPDQLPKTKRPVPDQ